MALVRVEVKTTSNLNPFYKSVFPALLASSTPKKKKFLTFIF